MNDLQTTEEKKPTFAELIADPELAAALTQSKFITPTPIQEQTIPFAVGGKDLIIQAKTGSGKTLAYVIPIIAKVRRLKHEHRSPRILVLAPTRELANQVHDVISTVTSLLPEGRIETPCIIGGADMDAQIAKLEKDCRIVVATPGRTLDLMRQKKLKLDACKMFVLDEADEMLSSGFLEDIRIILSRLPDERQGLFVSATITPRVEMLANSFLEKPLHVLVDSPEESMPPVEHLYADVGGDLMSKPNALCDIMETYRPGSAIVFCNTKSDTQLVEALLRRRGFEARRLNSDLSQKQRERVIKKIKNKDLPILVATDIAARGLDIEALDMVINYSIHEQPELYVHRTGRTGRAGRSGIAISLVGPRDFGSFHFIKKVVAADFKKIELPTDEEISQARLAHLYQMLRESQIQLTERDRLIATKLIRENSTVTEPSEEFIQIVAKLARHMMEHHVSGETKALEEEFVAESSAEDESEQRPQREHRRSSSDDRPREGRRESRRDDRERRESRHENGSEREHGGEHGGEHARERSREQRAPSVPLRIFVGRGSKSGLDYDSLAELLRTGAGIEPEDLRGSIIREYYTFLETSVPVAEKIVLSLNGKEFMGEPLVVEPAIELQGPRRRHQGGGSRHVKGGRSSSNPLQLKQSLRS
jgi:ATP-dependent RNA helicase DeaD